MEQQEYPERDSKLNGDEMNQDVAGAAEAAEPELTAKQWIMKNGPIIIILIALLIFLYNQFGVSGLITIAKVAIGLGLVIFVHELGHFLVAKWCGVKVDVFSIGFGPAIPGCRFQWGETTYKLALFPFGGYVQMLGQVDLQEEDDGSEVDPRSYKNKTVLQRMAIISAGVVMNFIMGAICFIVVFLGPGKDRLAPVVPEMDSGAPAFAMGIRTGAVVDRVGSIEKPYFEDLILQVLTAHIIDQPLVIASNRPNEPKKTITIKSLQDETRSKPMIGIGFPDRLQLFDNYGATGYQTPTTPKSAAGNASPPIAFGDKIIATTDPDNPGRLKELPKDPRMPEGDPNYGQRDYFAFLRRMQKLAGQPVKILVERDDGGTTKKVELTVPPEYKRTLGAVMAMGQITAVRKNSEAEKKITKKDTKGNKKGDVVEVVEVREPDGTITRFSHEPEQKVAQQRNAVLSAFALPFDVRQAIVLNAVAEDYNRFHEKRLDPVRLPDELRAWAKRFDAATEPAQELKVTLRVKRHNSAKKTPREFDDADVTLTWDNDWRYDQFRPMGVNSPIAIPELGFGYQVKTNVVHAAPDFAGAKNGKLRAGDVIEQVQIGNLVDQEGKETTSKWYDLKGEEKLNYWGQISWLLDTPNITKVNLKVNRDGETVELTLVPQEEKSWPALDRGFRFQRDTRRQKATGLVDAVNMGLRETYNRVSEVFLVLRGLITRRIGFGTIGGPVRIATIAYQAAEFDFWEFVVFIGFISINLAIINFLPIPVLDGGHMVFLTYELIRGKPASENVRVGATYAGLLFILLLFIFIMYLDITHLFF